MIAKSILRSVKQTSVRLINLSLAAIIGLSSLVVATPLIFSASASAMSNILEVGSGKTYATIQSAIDAASAGDTIEVYPGSYSETAPNSAPTSLAGTYQFGLFFSSTKPGLTLMGVDANGAPITNAANTQATITTNSNANFGPDGIFVEAANTTIQGLKINGNINPTDPSNNNNKTIEVVADNFKLQYSTTNVPSGGGSVYINDFSAAGNIVKSYHILDNIFPDGTSIDISSGAGLTGPLSGREILRNKFDLGNNGYNAISFNGSGTGVPWFVNSVGGAIITGNEFKNSTQYIRARGTYDNSQFDWASYWSNNTFDKKVLTSVDGTFGNVRTYSYPNSYGSFNNDRRIGGAIQGEITNAQSGDTIFVGAGSYAENLTINNPLHLVGPNSTVNPNTTTRNAEAVITGQISDYAGNTDVKGFTITNPSWNGATIKGIHVYSAGPVISSITLQNNILSNINNAATHGSYGIMVQGVTSGVNVLDNKFDHIYSAGWAHALEVTPTAGSAIVPQNTVITGNVFSNITDTNQSDALAFSVDSATYNHNPIYADASQITFSHNSILNNIRNLDPSHTLNATFNYWGSTHPVFSSIVSGKVTYDPYFTNAAMTNRSDAITVADSSGNAFVNPSTPQLIVTSHTQPIIVNVASGTTNATIDFHLMITGNTGTIPQTTVKTTGGNISIPASTTVTATGGTWDGVIEAPTIKPNSSVTVPTATGSTTTVGTVIEVGSESVNLTFDKAVRLFIPGQAGKLVGFVRGGVFTQIATPCVADTQADGDALPAGGNCYVNVGADMVVWTKHFTTFVTYTEAPKPITYTVVAGDTLSSIGARVGIDWHLIASDNNLAAPYTIYPGQVLQLPADSTVPTPAATTTSSNNSAVLGASSSPQIGTAANTVVSKPAVVTAQKANWFSRNWFFAGAAVVAVSVAIYYVYQTVSKKPKQ